MKQTFNLVSVFFFTIFTFFLVNIINDCKTKRHIKDQYPPSYLKFYWLVNMMFYSLDVFLFLHELQMLLYVAIRYKADFLMIFS